VTDPNVLQWREIGYSPAKSAIANDNIANTWEAPYQGGYLVLHAGPNGHESLVWVPPVLTVDWKDE